MYKTHLVPRNEEGANPRGEGTLAELEADGPAPVDHEVEPAVLLGHGVALRVEVLVADPHAHEATPRRGHDAAADDGGAAAKRGTLALSYFELGLGGDTFFRHFRHSGLVKGLV